MKKNSKNILNMKDTVEIVKRVITDPVPIINTTVLFGLSAAEWDLFLKIVVGLFSIIWTAFKIINEYKKWKSSNPE